MIVCSCNVLSDHDVRNAISASEDPLTTSQVYGCLGCSRQCGRCTRTIKKIMNEAMTDACTANCTIDHPHRHHDHHDHHHHRAPHHHDAHHDARHHDDHHHHDRHDHHHHHHQDPVSEPAPAFALAAAAA